MKKVAILLKVTDFDHCVANSIHLLLTTDSMARVPVIVDLLQKNKTIVRTLHFKTEIIEKEVQIGNDFIANTELLDKINDIKSYWMPTKTLSWKITTKSLMMMGIQPFPILQCCH